MKYEKFIEEAGLNSADFRWVFAFCNDGEHITEPELADELANLVLSGKKTATASALADYAEANEPLPTVDGKFDILLNGKGEPVAALTNTRVYQTKFNEVTAEHAFKEGEGNRTLAYWRQVHEEFFRELGLFSPDMAIICEEYKVLYKKEH